MNRLWILVALFALALALAAGVVGEPGMFHTLRAKWDATPTSPLPLVGASAGNSTVHKCRSSSGLSYSTGTCPPGSTEEGLASDRVTSISMPKPALLPAKPASLPTVRDLLVDPNGPDLKQMQMERTLNESR